MWNAIKAEPALLIGVLGAAIALLAGFGLQVSPEQVGLIMAFVSAVLAVVTRSVVTPAALVAAKDDGGTLVAGPAATVQDGEPVQVSAA